MDGVGFVAIGLGGFDSAGGDDASVWQGLGIEFLELGRVVDEGGSLGDGVGSVAGEDGELGVEGGAFLAMLGFETGEALGQGWPGGATKKGLGFGRLRRFLVLGAWFLVDDGGFAGGLGLLLAELVGQVVDSFGELFDAVIAFGEFVPEGVAIGGQGRDGDFVIVGGGAQGDDGGEDEDEVFHLGRIED